MNLLFKFLATGLLVFVFSVPAATMGQETAVKDLSAEQMKMSIKQRPGTILDVRTPGEVNKGYIPGAVHLDFYAEDFAEQLKEIDKSKPVYVYCKAGGRSAKAASMLLQEGHKEVYNLRDGILDWKKHEYPLDKPAP